MNRMSVSNKHILEIANDIEANGDTRPVFRMDKFFSPNPRWKEEGDWCNTSGCIAGYVSMLKYEKFSVFDNHEERAKMWLELDEHEAGELFYAHRAGIPIEEITTQMAVVCLRNFVATGEVDWAAAVQTCKEHAPCGQEAAQQEHAP